MAADLIFYKTTYMGDSIPDSDFPRLAKRAGEQLARYKHIYTVSAPNAAAENMAICAMAEALAYYEAAASGEGGVVSSAKIGSVSVSYAGAAGTVDLSSKAQERELYRCASLYLDIYRGCG